MGSLTRGSGGWRRKTSSGCCCRLECRAWAMFAVWLSSLGVSRRFCRVLMRKKLRRDLRGRRCRSLRGGGLQRRLCWRPSRFLSHRASFPEFQRQAGRSCYGRDAMHRCRCRWPCELVLREGARQHRVVLWCCSSGFQMWRTMSLCSLGMENCAHPGM